MDCEEIKKIIPRYFQHSATEEEIKKVEEHLCVCHDCRTTLGELMDKLSSPADSDAPAQEQESLPSSQETNTESEVAQESLLQSQASDKPEKDESEPKVAQVPDVDLGMNPDDGDRSVSEESDSVVSKEPAQVPEEKLEAREYEPPEPASSSEPDEKIKAPKEEQAQEPEDKKSEWDLEGDKFEADLKDKPDYSLDEKPLDENKISSIEYICLAIGVVAFLFIIYLLVAG